MWTFHHDQSTTATPAQIWAYYEATDIAPRWDPLIRQIQVQGPLAVGVQGINHPVGGGRFPFTYTEVTIDKSYTEVTRVPLARLAFTHDISPTPTGSIFTHGVIISGPLAWLYTLLLRRGYEKGIPQASRNLAALLEQGPPTSLAQAHAR